MIARLSSRVHYSSMMCLSFVFRDNNHRSCIGASTACSTSCLHSRKEKTTG